MNFMPPNPMYLGGSFAVLHMLCCLLIGVGILFLVIWAFKTLTPQQLKKWGIGLTAAGVVLCALASVAMALHGPRFVRMKVLHDRGDAMTDVDMDRVMSGDAMMMDDEMDHANMGHGMMNGDDHMSMSMADMSRMLEGKTGDAFDEAFVEGMIPHHQGAIDMAKAALTSAKHQEIKDMARDIIDAQQAEIDMMKQWQKSWGYAE